MKKFEVGKTYFTRSAFDHNCIWTITVLKRTAKTITVDDGFGGKVLRIIEQWSGDVEHVRPFGRYSMCPVINANEEWKGDHDEQRSNEAV